MPRAGSSISLHASNDFQGNSAARSTSAAWGATFSSAKVRIVSRNSRWTSVKAKVESLTRPFSQHRPNARSAVRPEVSPEVADQELGELDRGHLRDPVRHVLEHLERVR